MRQSLFAFAVVAAILVGHSTSKAQAVTGSISMDAALERSQLLANERGETFLRVALIGQKVALKKRLPMNVVVVIDRSGSMGGQSPAGTQKMYDAREAAKFLISQLQAGDKAAIVSFDNGAEVLSKAQDITPQSIVAISRKIDTLSPRGGTDMVSGLKTGLAQARALLRRDQVNRIILISDGHPNTTEGLNQLARKAAKKGVTVTTMGVGTDYNEDLMSTIADAGQGNYYFIKDSAKMAKIFEQELKTMIAVVAREAVIKIKLKNGVKVEEVYGYEASIGRTEAAIPVGDILGGRYNEVLTRLSFPAQKGQTELVNVTLAYHDALANKGRKLTEIVKAEFVSDAKAVTASINTEVAEKVEKVKIANATKQAMDEYRAGNIDKAKAIIRTQQKATSAANNSISSATLTTELKEMEDLEQSISAAPPAAEQSAVQKRAKQRARSLSR